MSGLGDLNVSMSVVTPNSTVYRNVSCLCHMTVELLYQFNPFVGGGKHASHLKEVPVDVGNAIPTSDL